MEAYWPKRSGREQPLPHINRGYDTGDHWLAKFGAYAFDDLGIVE